jgi:hypothetical protein
MAGLKIKQGETFSLDGQYWHDDAVTPKPLTGVVLTSQISNKSGTFTATLAITVLDEAAGTYRITAPLGTRDWPVGALYWDIKESVGGIDKFSPTVSISVERGITRL